MSFIEINKYVGWEPERPWVCLVCKYHQHTSSTTGYRTLAGLLIHLRRAHGEKYHQGCSKTAWKISPLLSISRCIAGLYHPGYSREDNLNFEGPWYCWLASVQTYYSGVCTSPTIKVFWKRLERHLLSSLSKEVSAEGWIVLEIYSPAEMHRQCWIQMPKPSPCIT